MLQIEVAQTMRQQGKVESAAEYLMRWLQQHKHDVSAWELLSRCMSDLGEHAKAEIALRRAISIDSTRTDLAIPLAAALIELSKQEEAIEVLQLALATDPENQDIGLFLGIRLSYLDRHPESLTYFSTVVQHHPENHVAWSFKSLAHTRLKDYTQALVDAEKSIALNDAFDQAWFAKGRVLQKMGHWQGAADSLERALQLNAENPLALDLLASVRVSMAEQVGDSDAVQLSRKNLKAFIQREAHVLRNGLFPKEISYFRLKHDIEQAQYLLDTREADSAHEQLVRMCRPLVIEASKQPLKKIQLTKMQSAALADYWLNLTPSLPDALGAGCLNRAQDWNAVEQEYLRSLPEIVVIDDFLSADALSAFQQFNLVSSAWTREYADNKYLGAFSNMGFATPLHFQLAAELRRFMPLVFQDHRLMSFWGFKYDALIGKGINVHADHARVNLNFWVTPDEFNLDSSSGGLQLYDAPAPQDWAFGDYNKNAEKIYEYLELQDAKVQTVTYRCNRAVLFNSALFHQTDAIRFVDTYRGRRVNMTYLFGEQLGI